MEKIVHTNLKLACMVKSVLGIVLVWYSHLLFEAITMISFLPDVVKILISDLKEILALCTTILIFLVTLKKLRKKEDEK